MKRAARLLSVLVAVCLLAPIGVSAASSAPVREDGLLITPIRQFLSVNAGATTKSTITVANLTGSPFLVALTIKEFSVTDYTYNYQFNQPSDDWIHLNQTSFNLQPNQTTTLPYTIAPPAGSSPGGHYFTLLASANVSTGGVNSTIQAADLVYLTVGGKLIRTSHLQHSSIHWLAFGRTISYSLQPINTGNVYFFAYVSGTAHGLLTAPTTGSTHLLMPGHVRAISGSIPSPKLPGIYRVTYGYKTDAGQSVSKSHIVVFIPPWFIAFLLSAVLFLGSKPGRKLRTRKPNKTTTSE